MNNDRMHRLVLTTMPGLEEVAEGECRELGLSGLQVEPGRVLARCEDGELAATVRRLNAEARCLDRVGVVLLEATVSGLDEAEAAIHEAPLEKWVAAGKSFAVRAVRRGGHGFQSPELAGAVGAAVIDSLRTRRGDRAPVDLDDPDVVLRVDLEDDRMLVWIDTTGYRALHERSWRGYLHMASMRPTVANLLLRLAGWGRDDGRVLVDPFCGGGTIPIEAASILDGQSSGRQRPFPWAWERVPRLAANSGTGDRPFDLAGDSAVDPPPPGNDEAPRRIVGVERFRRHLDGAIANARLAGVAGRIRFVGGLAERLERHGPRGFFAGALVVTNPPFGRRVASPRRMARTYAAAATSWAEAGVERVVTLTVLADAMHEALDGAGFGVERALPAVYGRSAVTVFVAGARP